MPDPRPLVSVLIAAHDAASDLPRAVGSALAQTLEALEVIVVDDASRDGTAAAAEALAHLDARVRLVRSERNLGPAGARNLALEAARGEWVAILDSDDALLPWRLEQLLRAARYLGADMIADNLLLAGPEAAAPPAPMLPPELLGAPRPVDAAAFLIGNLPVPGRPRVSYGFLKPVIRRSFLTTHRLRYDPGLRFAEDFDFTLRVLLARARFWLLPEAGYLYTVRETSLTARHSARDLLRLRALNRRLLRGPHVQDDRRLRRALHDHASSIDRRLVWRRFTDAVKAGAWRRAAARACASPGSAAVVARELARLAPRRALRPLRRLFRRGRPPLRVPG